MKKIIAVIICIALLSCISGCKAGDKELKQEITIVKTPASPKCKTTENINIINDILSIMSAIEKTPCEDKINGWQIMIKLNVDGQEFTYTFNNTVFTDSDGRQYLVNGTEVINEISDIYNKLEAPEK